MNENHPEHETSTQLRLDLPEPAPVPIAAWPGDETPADPLPGDDLTGADVSDDAVTLRFRLDDETRELGRRQVALIKAQLAERAARRAA